MSSKEKEPTEKEVTDRMLKRAEEYGLELEVKRSYADRRAQGDPPELAALRALWDWDL